MVIREGQGDNPGQAFALEEGETVGCYFCMANGNGQSYKRGEAVLCGADCPPYDANANYVCMSCLSPTIEIYDATLNPSEA